MTNPTPTTPTEPVEPTDEEMLEECAAIEVDRRLWVRTITAFLAGRARKTPDQSQAVQTASDLAAVAAYDRLARIFRSDDLME